MKKNIAMIAALSAALFGPHLMAQAPAGAPGASGGGRGRAGGGRAGGFPQYTREIPSQDVLARGKSLYDTNCASCHAPDLRGVLAKNGPNLLRSTETFSDKQGELVAANLLKHTPAINLPEADTVAISEYIHSVQATMGGQGSPPGRNPVGLTYDVLVGNAKDGAAAFA